MRALFVSSVPLGSGLATVTVTVTVPLAPGFWLLRFHVTMPPACEQVAPLQLAYVVLAGSASVMTTPCATAVPPTDQLSV